MSTEQIPQSMPADTCDREIELKPLLGLSLLQIKRDATWLQLNFGKSNEQVGERSDAALLGEWMVEVYHPCAWRLSKPGEIITGSGDLDNMESGYYQDLADPRTCTRFDVMASLFQREIEDVKPVVKSIAMEALEGFRMQLSGGYELVVFPAGSQKSITSQYWCVMKPTKGKRNQPPEIRIYDGPDL